MFVQPYGQRGGAERYLELLLDRLPRSLVGTIFCLQAGPFPELLDRLGYETELLPTSARPADMLRAARVLRPRLRGAPVVHGNGIKGALIAGVATLGTRTRVVWVKHDFSWDGPLAWLTALLSAKVVGVSRAAVANLTRVFRRRTVVIYNGVPQPEVAAHVDRADLRDLLGAPGDPFVISLVGRLHEVKGHRDLIRIGPDLLERIPEGHVAVIGGVDPSVPEYAAELRTKIDAAGLSDRFHLLGFRDDASGLMAASDVVVMPSGRDSRGMGREAFPLVALEALAVGVPVIAYADGGVPELVGDCALLVPPGDTDALLTAITTLYRSPTERSRLQRCGAKRVSLFTVDRMVAEMERLYRSLGAA